MAFEQELRAYLEQRENESRQYYSSFRRRIDVPALHRYLLDRLRLVKRVEDQAALQSLFDEWTANLPLFARYLETLPKHLAPLDQPSIMTFAQQALDVALGYVEPPFPIVEQLELKRIVEAFTAGRGTVETYALENLLVRDNRRRRPKPTEIGRALLQLRGKDAIRWLLINEVLQSTGRGDDWRTPRVLLEEALTDRGIRPSSNGAFGYSKQTRDRLLAFGVLEADIDDSTGDVTRYHVAATMREPVHTVLEAGPWHAALQALLEDQHADALPGVFWNTTDATIEQTKLIVHEVRNALIPVRHDVEALRSLATAETERQRIDSAKRGIARVLDFVTEMAEMSELITEPATRCEIGSIADESLGWADQAHKVERIAPSAALYVVAPRARLVRALSNVIGNALQATTAGEPVRFVIAQVSGLVRISVDDGGPGVPVDQRARIFLEGVTMRRDGAGSGFGLAFARRVVESALQGKIWCEDSDLGGARFVIEIPEAND